jgi:hypothetical protein
MSHTCGQACAAVLLRSSVKYVAAGKMRQKTLRALLRAHDYELGPRRPYQGVLPRNALLWTSDKHWMLVWDGILIDPCGRNDPSHVVSYFLLLGKQLEMS